MDRAALFKQRLSHALALSSRRRTTHGYAPRLAYGRHEGPALPDARHGAVLALFFPDADDWNVVLTERTSHLPTHAGQVSFPGGRIEPGESPAQAALREFTEELGPLTDVEVIGALQEYFVFASNFVVTPVLAMTSAKPRYVPNPHEVADVIEVSLSRASDPVRQRVHPVIRGPLRFSAPHLEAAGKRIWGVTWVILGEIIERLQSLGPLKGL